MSAMRSQRAASPSSARASTSSDDDVQKVITAEHPQLHVCAAYFISVWSFKAATNLALWAQRFFSTASPNLLKPEVKSYPARPFLKNRIFRPQDLAGERLPLYLDVHGGGWAVGDPQTDDDFCSFIAQNFNTIVVSIDYRKSPRTKFPHAIWDVAVVADAVIRDESLNIDGSKVALGGFSAGGNLAFAAGQLDLLKGRVHGLVGIYPCLDLAESLQDKMNRRPRDAGSDFLESSARFLDWAYVPPRHNRKYPLLSPRWAERQDLPEHVYLVGAEHDMLCYEANQMAESLVSPEFERETTSTPPAAFGWKQGRVRWECARRRQHAFTHVKMRGEKEKERLMAVEDMYRRVGAWLQEDVWVDSSCNSYIVPSSVL